MVTHDFSIRTKLLVGFGLALALSIGVGLFALFQLSQFNDFGRALTQRWIPEVENTNKLQRAMTEYRRLAERRLATTSYRQLAEIVEDMRQVSLTVDAAISAYAEVADDPGELTTLQAFAEQWARYVTEVRNAFGLMDSGQPDQAKGLFYGGVMSIYRAASAELDRLHGLAEAEGIRTAGTAQETYIRFLRLTIAVIAVAALWAMIAYLWITRTISTPIRLVGDAMKRLSAGDYSVSIESSEGRKDEVGDLLVAAAGYRESQLRSHRLAEEASLERQRLRAAIDNMPVGLTMINADKELIICNERYAEMYRLPSHLTKPGTPLRTILEYRLEVGSQQVSPGDHVKEVFRRLDRRVPYADLAELQDGRFIHIAVQPLESGGWVAIQEDITARLRAEERIAHLASHDTLTDLPNRVFFRECVERALEQAEQGASVAVLTLDLDRFKSVNDTLGHPTGDALLRGVAERLKACVREGAAVARLGGDEFAIVQTGQMQPLGATTLAERIIETLGASFEIGGQQIISGASIGIAIGPNDGLDPDQLIKNADMALSRAKKEGRGTYRFFEYEMDARMQARRMLEMDLRRALVMNEFVLYYQPQLNLTRNMISGFEALLRWQHPERGLVPPGEFIPLAEEIGLIVPLGEWALRHACAEASTWPEGMKVSVNLSPAQFKGADLLQTVESALAESGLRPERLELEITESVLLIEDEAVLATLHALHDLGVGIAMDDFGTGYSSLSYLRSFPFDKIKIDRSFVRDLAPMGSALAIVRAVTGLGTSLGMETTAEGVETIDQLMRVRQEGCTEVQGYLIGKPMPASEIKELLKTPRWPMFHAA
jgi:diguanylate cyclase (GGDEF)-like protein